MSATDTSTETPVDIRPATAIRDPLANHLITPLAGAERVTASRKADRKG